MLRALNKKRLLMMLREHITPRRLVPALRFTAVLFGLALCGLFLDNHNARAADADPTQTVAAPKPLVKLHTSRGDIVIELWPDKSPKTVANFLQYVDAGFYDGTIFHRVIRGMLIQGGGYNRFMQLKPTRPPIRNEAKKSRLKHERGTIAMARLLKPNTATAQFFINVRLNSQLNARVGEAGYAVFGQVVQGMDIVDAISQQSTGTLGAFSDVPQNLIIIDRATRITSAPSLSSEKPAQ